jgi:nucleoside-diphosphate kinase
VNQTLIIFKPDCVRRGLVGECLARFERRGFTIRALAVLDPVEAGDRLRAHYAEHEGKPYYNLLLRMMMSGSLVTCALNGSDVVVEARRLAGPYQDPIPGTIRGDYATGVMYNVIHTSADDEAAAREVAIWFPDLI